MVFGDFNFFDDLGCCVDEFGFDVGRHCCGIMVLAFGSCIEHFSRTKTRSGIIIRTSRLSLELQSVNSL
jgi:hypothetical protein